MDASEQVTLVPLMMTVMKSSFAGTFLLIHLINIASGLGSVVSRHYTYINVHCTWQEAQSYCRSSYGKRDLATIYRQSDIAQQDLTSYNAWIGLHRETDENLTLEGWTWSNGETLDFIAWDANEPSWGERCGHVTYTSKKLRNAICGTVLFFICDNSEFISEPKTWDEAKSYCMENYNYLATFRSISDIDSRVSEEDFPVWIGLHRDGETWEWSSGMSDYRSWSSGETSNNGDCVSVSSVSKKMATQNCFSKIPFICYEDNLVLIQENKTWEEALAHCRALSSPTDQYFSYELVSVQPEDYNIIMDVVSEASTEEVWTGLRFLAGKWLWVNGADMMYSDLPLCPPMVQRCGVLTKTGTDGTETRDCSERKNFMCYRKV